MRIPRKVGRFRAVIAAAVLGIGMLAAVPASTQSAVAEAAQPSVAEDLFCNPSTNAVANWATRSTGGGVILCEGSNTFGLNEAYVQIVDLNAGAKVRLLANYCYSCNVSDTTYGTDAQFHKRTASEWFTWGQSNEDVPAPSRLFSTSNGSFFTDTASATSPFSLPQWRHIETYPGGAIYVEDTFGWAFDTCPEDPNTVCHDDAAWNAPKKAISLGDATATKQKVQMLDFQTNYTVDAVHSLWGMGSGPGDPNDDVRLRGDSTVGFTPTYDGGTGSMRRTFVGVNSYIADTVYILNTSEDFTVAEAQNILKSFGSAFEMQLDGGGSTQLYGPDLDADGQGDHLIDSYTIPDRPVPDALAVYLAP